MFEVPDGLLNKEDQELDEPLDFPDAPSADKTPTIMASANTEAINTGIMMPTVKAESQIEYFFEINGRILATSKRKK